MTYPLIPAVPVTILFPPIGAVSTKILPCSPPSRATNAARRRSTLRTYAAFVGDADAHAAALRRARAEGPHVAVVGEKLLRVARGLSGITGGGAWSGLYRRRSSPTRPSGRCSSRADVEAASVSPHLVSICTQLLESAALRFVFALDADTRVRTAFSALVAEGASRIGSRASAASTTAFGPTARP
jgi:hypothetical protein